MASKKDYSYTDLKDDIREIKDELIDNRKNIAKLYNEQGKLILIMRGNGHEGLCAVVERHEKKFNQIDGVSKFLITAIGGGWLITLLTLIYAVFK